uniref:Ig-like domain-containing protein n=1 Tax=Anopheles melas TaxID=34690 RepID=A0A182U5Y3_9DIPT
MVSSFHWRFNNSAEILPVDAHRYTSQGNISILNYAPVTDQPFTVSISSIGKGSFLVWYRLSYNPPKHPSTTRKDYETIHKREPDFGTLTCWAVNEVGPQSQPCTFQLVLAGRGT